MNSAMFNHFPLFKIREYRKIQHELMRFSDINSEVTPKMITETYLRMIEALTDLMETEFHVPD